MPEAKRSRFSPVRYLTGQWLLFILGMTAILFVPAGTVYFFRGWLWLGTLTVAAGYITLYLYRHDRHLLERRLVRSEKIPKQKLIMAAIGLVTVLALIIPGLDFRYGRLNIPTTISIIADVIILTGFLIIKEVFKTNTFTSSIIEVEKNQKVVTLGLYKYIRHPMYLGAAIITGFTPVALGSVRSLLIMAPLLPLLILRIVNEEKVLTEKLSGYKAYCNKIPYRLIPGVW